MGRRAVQSEHRKFAVLGLGNFGSSLARNLADLGSEVIAIDSDERKLDELADHVTLAVSFDVTDEHLLRANGVDKVDVAIVAMGSDFGASVLVTTILRDMGVRVHSRATTHREARILRAVGASQIYMPEKDQGERVARMLQHDNVETYVPLAGGIDFVRVKPRAAMIGKCLKDLDIRRAFGVNIAYIGKMEVEEGVRTYRIPLPDDVIELGDDLFILGGRSDLERFLS